MRKTDTGLYTGYVYKISNSVNNKVYIGETIQGIQNRFRQHMRDSHTPKHRCYNCHFYRAIRKYGIDKFFVQELESVSGTNKNDVKKKIQELEVHYINTYDSFKNGCNSDSGGRGGKVISENTRKIQSLIKKSDPNVKKKLDYARQFRNIEQAVNVFDYNTGEIINSFESIAQASNYYNIDSSSVSACCKGKHEYLRILENKKVVFRYIKDIYNSKYTVEMYTDDGSISEKFVQAADAGNKYNIDKSSIIRCCKGKVRSAGKINGVKLKWKYINEEI